MDRVGEDRKFIGVRQEDGRGWFALVNPEGKIKLEYNPVRAISTAECTEKESGEEKKKKKRV